MSGYRADCNCKTCEIARLPDDAMTPDEQDAFDRLVAGEDLSQASLSELPWGIVEYLEQRWEVTRVGKIAVRLARQAEKGPDHG